MKKSVEIKFDLGKALTDSVKWKNTFLPNFKNKEVTLSQLRVGIKLSFVKPEQIPKEIRNLL